MSTEAHLTLSHPMCTDAALRAWVASRGLTFTSIELSHGVSPHQAMITLWAANRDDALREVRKIRSELAELGVGVSRVKLEVAHVPGAPAVPALYLEHHVKVRTTPERIAELGLLGVTRSSTPSTRRRGLRDR